jgi:hypothetical protein
MTDSRNSRYDMIEASTTIVLIVEELGNHQSVGNKEENGRVASFTISKTLRYY